MSMFENKKINMLPVGLEALCEQCGVGQSCVWALCMDSGSVDIFA